MSTDHVATRDPRFPQPMFHAQHVATLTHDGETYRTGQRIAFNVAVHDHRKSKQHTERREATISELWIEDWHGRDLPYAECLTDNGTAARVWFHRDKAGTPMGVTGRLLPNALF